MADYGYQYQHQLQMGSPCAEETLRKFLHMRWALSVMNRTPLSTDTDNCLCVDYATACDVIQGADTLCVSCGCGCESEIESNPPPSPPLSLNSFLVRAETIGTVATVFPVAGATAIPFDFVNEDEWTISFWQRWYDPAIPANNVLLTLMNPEQRTQSPPSAVGAELFIRMNDVGGGQMYMSLELSINGSPSNQATVAMFPFPSIVPDEYHMYTLRKNGSYGTGASWTWFMDGQPTGTLFLNSGTPWDNFLFSPQAPMIGANQRFADTPSSASWATQEFYMAELYVCGTARTDQEIQDIFYTNTMNFNDATWNRLVWLHPHQPPDASLVSNGIANDGQLPNYTALNNVEITTVVPPQLS